MKTFEKFQAVEASMNSVLLEREEVIHTALLAIASKAHHLQYGDSGGAKSMLVDLLCDHISDFGPDDKFTYKLTKFTEDSEVMGHLDFFGLTKENVYRKVIKRRLPSAIFAFLDELERASSPLQDSLLGVMEERQYDAGEGPIPVPLVTLFSATNFLLKGDSSIALADRFLFWHKVEQIANPANKAKLLRMDDSYEPEATILLQDVANANKEVQEVEFTDESLDTFMTILDALQDEGIHVSDRRARAAVKAVKAEAWLRGSTKTEVSDLAPLKHTFWREVNEIDKVMDIVDTHAAPFSKRCRSLRGDVATIANNFSEALSRTNEPIVIENTKQEYFLKFKAVQQEITDQFTEIRSAGGDIREIKAVKEFCDLQFNSFKKLSFGIGDDTDVYSSNS